MAVSLEKITFEVTPEMEPVLNEAMKMFHDKTQEEVIRMLIVEGLKEIKREDIK